MENEKYLSEERYQKNNKKVRSIGKIVLIIGIVIFNIFFILAPHSISKISRQLFGKPILFKIFFVSTENNFPSNISIS